VYPEQCEQATTTTTTTVIATKSQPKSTLWIKDAEELTITRLAKKFAPFYGNCKCFSFIVNSIL
jgi:hypothetical protein